MKKTIKIILIYLFFGGMISVTSGQNLSSSGSYLIENLKVYFVSDPNNTEEKILLNTADITRSIDENFHNNTNVSQLLSQLYGLGIDENFQNQIAEIISTQDYPSAIIIYNDMEPLNDNFNTKWVSNCKDLSNFIQPCSTVSGNDYFATIHYGLHRISEDDLQNTKTKLLQLLNDAFHLQSFNTPSLQNTNIPLPPPQQHSRYPNYNRSPDEVSFYIYRKIENEQIWSRIRRSENCNCFEQRHHYVFSACMDYVARDTTIFVHDEPIEIHHATLDEIEKIASTLANLPATHLHAFSNNRHRLVIVNYCGAGNLSERLYGSGNNTNRDDTPYETGLRIELSHSVFFQGDRYKYTILHEV